MQEIMYVPQTFGAEVILKEPAVKISPELPLSTEVLNPLMRLECCHIICTLGLPVKLHFRMEN